MAWELFLSTPSARRATALALDGREILHISIHALREEGDAPRYAARIAGSAFLSTPSARRATLRPGMPLETQRRFLSTPSARRATPSRT